MMEHDAAILPVRGTDQHRIMCDVCGWLTRVPDVDKAKEIADRHPEIVSRDAETETGP